MLSHPKAVTEASCAGPRRPPPWHMCSVRPPTARKGPSMVNRGNVHRLTPLRGGAGIYGESLDISAHPSGPRAPQPSLALGVAASASPEARSS